jgi:hypothetical protein
MSDLETVRPGYPLTPHQLSRPFEMSCNSFVIMLLCSIGCRLCIDTVLSGAFVADIMIHVPVHDSAAAIRFEETLNRFAESRSEVMEDDGDQLLMVRTDFVGGAMRKTVVFQRRSDADAFTSFLTVAAGR